VRRLLMTALAAGVVALNRKFGLDLNAEEIAALAALALGYLAQSAAVDRARILAAGQAAADAAAGKVETAADAAAVLKGGGK